MIRAIQPQGGIAEGGIDEGAVMRSRRIVMDMRAKMAAGQAHALHGDGARLLQGTDDQHERPQQRAAFGSAYSWKI